MLKKIDAAQLKLGMYIHDLSCDWMTHPFVRSRFLITRDEEIRKIVQAGIHAVVIDNAKGRDVRDALTLAEAEAATERELLALVGAPLPAPAPLSLGAEMARAEQIRTQAGALVRGVMVDARLGRAVELDRVAPVVQGVLDSIARNAGALVGLQRIKANEDYLCLHSVSVCSLLVAFCRARGLAPELIQQAALGALLHDIGKALVPDKLLNKPGALTEAEFELVRRHPGDGHAILLKSANIGPIPLDIARHHHERRDGSGYPDKLAGDQISELAQMTAIVDVYTAITADRAYHKGLPAAAALRQIYEWSKFHFNPQYAREFMRCIGIYPVGTLVMLESRRLGVVIEPHPTNLLAPKVNVFFDSRRQVYIRPETLDLSRGLGFGGGDKIVGHELPARWNVDPMRFLSLA